jgi:small subunit ribosomal protein S5
MSRSEKKDDQIIEKLINVRRVTKVVKGGKNLRFSALVIVGDGKGRAGYATGKAREVPEAFKKAVERARKNMVRIPLREGRTLHHDVSVKIGAGRVCLRSAPAGTGVIVGGAMRAVFEALGVHDVVGKSIGTSNYNNVVKATFDALRQIHQPRYIASKLGKKLSEINERRSRKQSKVEGEQS